MTKLGVVVYTNNKEKTEQIQSVLLKEVECLHICYISKMEELFEKLKEGCFHVLIVDNVDFAHKEFEKFMAVIHTLFIKQIVVVGERFDSCKNMYFHVASFADLPSLMPTLLQNFVEMSSSAQDTEKHISLNQAVVQDLMSLGLQPKHCGFQYLQDCVLIGIMSKGKLKNLTKEIYPLVASKYCVSNQCVERSIRYTIDFSVYNCKHNKVEHTNDLTQFIWDFPTNRNVISFLIHKIMIEQNMLFTFAE